MKRAAGGALPLLISFGLGCGGSGLSASNDAGSPEVAPDALWPECVPTTARQLAMLPEPIGEHPVMIADGTTLYVGAFRNMNPDSHQVIWTVSKSTGAVSELWTGTAIEGVGGLALDGADLYFTTFSTVQRVPKAGGTAQ